MHAKALLLVICAFFIGAASATEVRLVGLDGAVDVYRDEYGIPHVYAESWTDAARVLGYLHASDRLWQMDLLRRQASGTTAEVMGADALEHDIQMRRLGIRGGCDALWNSGELPDAFVAELEAYVVTGGYVGVSQIHGLGPVGYGGRFVAGHHGG
jgi:acyl-homoserine lactone acylase PvdQ